MLLENYSVYEVGIFTVCLFNSEKYENIYSS